MRANHDLVFRLSIAVSLAVGFGCRHRSNDGAPAPTMVPTPTASATDLTGGDLAVRRAGACSRYTLCCQQLFAQIPSGGASANICSQITTTMMAGGNDSLCETAMQQLVTSMSSSPSIHVPAICHAAGGPSLFGGGTRGSITRRGAGPGAMMPIGTGMTISGELQSGDTVQPDGALSDDYRIYLTAGSPVTIIARGGTARSGTSGNLDMWLVLMQAGTELTHDDDSAGSLNSRIVYTPSTSGIYIIRVRTYGSGAKEGDYTLQTYAGALYSQT